MKLIIKLLLLIFFINSISFAEILKEFKIDGNKRISSKTIILFSKVKINDDINESNLNEIIKELYSTNFFKDVKVSFSNQILKITVKENPVIQSLIFNGIKKKNIISTLKSNVELKEKNPFLKNTVKSDETQIINILRSNGYYFSKVESEIKNNDNYTVDLIYNIDLGKKAHIKKIKFIGDKKFKDGKLRNIIVSEETKFWKFISNKKFLDINRISLDEKLLKNYYKNRGYYNIKIESSSAKVIDDDNFELIFNINAGNKYYFNNLNLNFPSDFSEDEFSGITLALNKLKGETYSLKKINSILKEIDKLLLNNDYSFFNATYNENLYDNKLDLTINLTESEKKYVERINVFGNYITNDKVIRNELQVDEGDPYNKILLNNSINEIRSLGIFKNVKSKVYKGKSEEFNIVDITVEEMPTGEIMAGAGTGTSGSSITFGIKEKNYLGEGKKLDANLTISDTSITGLFSTTTKNYKNSNKDLNTSLENSSLDRMSSFGYKSTKTGFSLGTSYEQYKDVYFSPSLSNYYETMKTSSSASNTRKKQEGDYIDSTFNYKFTLNKLNQNFRPSDGYKVGFYQSLPLYSDDLTIVNQFDYSKYFTFLDDQVFAVNFLLKTANSISGEDIRVSKRLYIPSRRLRGFESGKVGPVDSGDFIGGNYSSILNLSTNLPKFLPEVQNLDFTLFLDAANLWGVDFDSSLDNSKIRSSTGLAIDWFTPIGPLNFSFATPITKSSSDVEQTFRFDIGTTF